MIRLPMASKLTAFVLGTLLLAGRPAMAAEPVTFTGVFAPTAGLVTPQEQPFRKEVCLNGTWQFQPVAVPPGFVRGQGTPPELPPPTTAWEATPIKIPSPWNVNAWGCGRHTGAGTDHPYWPDSIYFPSYPAAWDQVEMGYLRRTFVVPSDWAGSRLVLHFQAVAGACQVWVNGQEAGRHFDKYLPFELDVTNLVRPDGLNELLVGVRGYSLFEQHSARYPKMRAPFPCGSETERLVGIWQDVFLEARPALCVADVFVKPQVDQDTLELEATLRNDTAQPQQFALSAQVAPWLPAPMERPPQPHWQLATPVLTLPAIPESIAPGATRTLTLRQTVNGQLQLWAPGTPNLYAAVVTLTQNGAPADCHTQRFGWRQFKIAGPDLLLNGHKIQLTGDLLHPFGPFVLSPHYAWAWYRLIQDFGGNAVRLHAQPHPVHYLDLADEMGLVVLDETALFGSSIALNFDAPSAWPRFADHYDGLVLRDRNHPAVLGWSFGNELFAIFALNQVSPADADRWYAQLAELGRRARKLDPTRDWISCDGDEDLRGTLPVWSKHFGHGTPLERLPALKKPLMVGESGGSYYARPSELAVFNGPRAYEDYAGRNEALAIDVYDNIVRMARPRLAFYSASETAWFGVEHLPLGYHDFSRLPAAADGVMCTRPFAQGQPGIQPERIPPYVATLNPGWDPGLPLYKPLAMVAAEKAALAPAGPQRCRWDHKALTPAGEPAEVPHPTLTRVGLLGARHGPLAQRLEAWGVPVAEPLAADDKFVLVDADTLDAGSAAAAQAAIASLKTTARTVLIIAGNSSAGHLADILPEAAHLTDRPATALVADPQHPWTANLSVPQLYFAEQGPERFIMQHGLAGPLVQHSAVLLTASNSDWALFNNAPETAKCGAALLYEQLEKPAGTALIEYDAGRGKLALCTLDYRRTAHAADVLWRTVLTNMGIVLAAGHDALPAAFDDHGVLVRALTLGALGAADLPAALARAAPAPGRPGTVVNGCTWGLTESPSKDRFNFSDLHPTPAPGSPVVAAYFDCWLQSPRALDDLLAGGPDVPRVTLLGYVAEKCRLQLNGLDLSPARTEPADTRTLYVFDALPLKKGWNHLRIQVAATPGLGSLAVRLLASQSDFLPQLQSAAQPPP